MSHKLVKSAHVLLEDGLDASQLVPVGRGGLRHLLDERDVALASFLRVPLEVEGTIVHPLLIGRHLSFVGGLLSCIGLLLAVNMTHLALFSLS